MQVLPDKNGPSLLFLCKQISLNVVLPIMHKEFFVYSLKCLKSSGMCQAILPSLPIPFSSSTATIAAILGFILVLFVPWCAYHVRVLWRNPSIELIPNVIHFAYLWLEFNHNRAFSISCFSSGDYKFFTVINAIVVGFVHVSKDTCRGMYKYSRIAMQKTTVW